MKYFQFIYSRSFPGTGEKQWWFALSAEGGQTSTYFVTDPGQAELVALFVVNSAQGKKQPPKILTLDSATLTLASTETDLAVTVSPSQGETTSERFSADEYQRMMLNLAVGVSQSQMTGAANPLSVILEGREVIDLGG